MENKFKFRDVFWRVWKELGYKLPGEEFKQFCFVFDVQSELIDFIIAKGRMNEQGKSVLSDKRENIVLHGVKNTITMKEDFDLQGYAQKYSWDFVKSVPLEKIKEQVAHMDRTNKIRKTKNFLYSVVLDFDPLLCAGIVISDLKDGKRVKMLHPAFVSIKKLQWNYSDELISAGHILEIIRTSSSKSFLSVYPQWRHFYEKVGAEYEEMIEYILQVYETSKGKFSSEKEFGKWAEKTGLKNCLFAMRKRNVSDKDGVKLILKKILNSTFSQYHKAFLKKHNSK